MYTPHVYTLLCSSAYHVPRYIVCTCLMSIRRFLTPLLNGVFQREAAGWPSRSALYFAYAKSALASRSIAPPKPLGISTDRVSESGQKAACPTKSWFVFLLSFPEQFSLRWGKSPVATKKKKAAKIEADGTAFACLVLSATPQLVDAETVHSLTSLHTVSLT